MMAVEYCLIRPDQYSNLLILKFTNLHVLYLVYIYMYKRYISYLDVA